MAVFLAVLKFIVLAVAVLLAIAVIIILTVLFVPVRYRLSGSLKDRIPDGSLKLTWLFHLLSLDLVYDREELVRGRFKILGIPVYRFGESAPKEVPNE